MSTARVRWAESCAQNIIFIWFASVNFFLLFLLSAIQWLHFQFRRAFLCLCVAALRRSIGTKRVRMILKGNPNLPQSACSRCGACSHVEHNFSCSHQLYSDDDDHHWIPTQISDSDNKILLNDWILRAYLVACRHLAWRCCAVHVHCILCRKRTILLVIPLLLAPFPLFHTNDKRKKNSNHSVCKRCLL